MTTVTLPFRYRWTWTVKLNGEFTDDIYVDFEKVRKAAKRYQEKLGYRKVDVFAHFENDKYGPAQSVVWDRTIDGAWFTRAGVPRNWRPVGLAKHLEATKRKKG